MNQQIQVGQRTLLIHPGLPDALEVLQWEFEKVYVGKPLHMVGYLDRIGSDNYIVVDDIGNVYKAEDTILRVVGENIEKYFADGLETDEYYDYYGYLDKEKSRQCVANYDDEVEYLQISKGSAFEELPNDTDSLTGEEMEEIQQISYFADFLVDPCH
uniref:Uncharacterized protein LOC102801629 n=1 Tax=Saccoglossus kowalevskii TaxID=10224 RepID=A0ABM0M1G2_SACKO|nr:PREDICTED: uncharacterized protein LOC102801629 [Saccoglossus kowalevskii]